MIFRGYLCAVLLVCLSWTILGQRHGPNDVPNPVRLISGGEELRQSEGRLEILVNGTWGTVCDQGWDENDARVVCRQLGFSSYFVMPVGGAFFGRGSGPVHLTSVDCHGYETDLASCTFPPYGHHTCTHNNDAGVICSPYDIPIRLVGGYSDSNGRVEIQVNGQWGTVCDDAWDANDAKVVCRQLGYTSTRVHAMRNGFFGAGNGLVLMDGVQCTGLESHVAVCPFAGFAHHTTCSHGHDAGVICLPLEIPVRLVGGAPSQGRVEVEVDGEWGTVCDDHWDEHAAEVVCRQLGFNSSGAFAIRGSFFGDGSGPIMMDDLTCTGTETNLVLCPFPGFRQTTCNHNKDAGVICDPASVEVRLVGHSAYEGRVEIKINGTWGTVCGDYWGVQDAEVVCRQLGFKTSHVLATTAAFFGQGTDRVLMERVECVGAESHLINCPFAGFGTANCPHTKDAGAICLPEEIPVRLVGGNSSSNGRVEIQVNGQWGTVCDDEWDANDAQVVCRQLGFTSTRVFAMRNAFFGSGDGPVVMDGVRCTGMESHLALCPFSGFGSTCSHGRDAAVICSPLEIPVRLIGGTPSEGRVEVEVDGEWGTVCHNYWDGPDAQVVCRQLGFDSSRAIALGGAFYGDGFGPVQMEGVRCTGKETSLALCPFSGFKQSSCSHNEDAGVICDPSSVEVRIVGVREYEGRVEMKINGTWGTVCGDYWDASDAEVVCRQLGFNSSHVSATTGAFFGQGTGRVLMERVQCTGTESHLIYCPFSGFGTTTCSHTNDAGVVCSPSEIEVRLVGGSPSEGRVELKIDGQWGTICDDRWDAFDAEVVCRQLGFHSSMVMPIGGAFYGQGSGPIFMTNIQCARTEPHIALCSSNAWGYIGSCTHARDAGVMCNPLKTPLRLAGAPGASSSEGRVELFINGVWSTVCDSYWDRTDTKVVCKQLGYSGSVAIPVGNGFFGQGEGPVGIINPRCTGTESHLILCQFNGFGATSSSCNHDHDAGVVCEPFRVRLVNGPDHAEGRVEVLINGAWGTVCDDNYHVWDDKEAEVVCRQLGYNISEATGWQKAWRYAHYGQGTGPIPLGAIECNGDEKTLAECSFQGIGYSTSCTHASDVGVKCAS